MRPAFSLAGLLVVIGIGLLIFRMIEAPAVNSGQHARQEAQQLSGQDADGAPASASITLEAHSDNGRLASIDVASIVAGGAMERYYGLQTGDKIIEIINVMPIRDVPNSDGELAKALVAEAYQKQQQLVVLRGSDQLTLPASPAAGTPSTDKPLSPAERLLQNTKIPTH